MHIETTVASTEVLVAPTSSAGPDGEGFGTRPPTGRPHSMNLFGPTQDGSSNGGSRSVDLLLGIGLGAAAMYYLDPERGGQRRTEAREGILQAVNAAPEAFESVAQEVGHLARRAVGNGSAGEAVRDLGAHAEDSIRAGRLAATALGGLLTVIAAKRRDAFGAAIGLLGSALLARGAGKSISRRMSPRSEMSREPVPGEIGDAVERPRLLE